MTGVVIDTRTGPVLNTDGPGNQPLRQGRMAALVTQDAHARFWEATSRGLLFSGGMTTTSIAAATFTTATTGATATPIAGVYNPLSSGKSLSILQVRIQLVLTAAGSTGPGALMWMAGTSQSAISTGNAPIGRASLLKSGSVAKDMSGLALTGLSGTIAVLDALGIQGVIHNLTMTQTAPVAVGSIVEHVDGGFVVPPGGVLGVFGTTTPVAVSAASSILWEELPAMTTA